MLGLRSQLIISAIAVGVTLGAVAWFVLGASLANPPLAEPTSQPPRFASAPLATAATSAVSAAMARPLFIRPNGAGPATVRLFGISRTPSRAAALVSINNKPAQWLSMGTTQEGVTLLEVNSAGVTIETNEGPSTLKLGQATPPSATQPSPAVGGDQPPAGFRMPPPPASAPRP